MKVLVSILCAGLILATVSCSKIQTQNTAQDIFDLPKAKQGDLIAKVNDTEIHQGLLDILKELNPRVEQQLSNPMTRKKIITSLIDQQLLYQEATKRNLASQEDVIMKYLINRHAIITNALLQQEVEQAMTKAYEEKKDSQFTKLKVALIAANFKKDEPAKDKKEQPAKPTDTEVANALERIQKIKARIDKGEDFAKMAQAESDDKLTSKKGGDAGKISKDDKRFERLGYGPLVTAAFAMKKDQVSDPIKTDKGYFLIKVTDDPSVVPYEEAKRVLGFELQNKIKDDLLAKLKNGAKIEYATVDTPEPKKEDSANPLQNQLNMIQSGIQQKAQPQANDPHQTLPEPKKEPGQASLQDKLNMIQSGIHKQTPPEDEKNGATPKKDDAH
ncbi:MAG TPA: peptidylprolyl isomerase [bacterium]|nr:peptidylprolyl isomerase [bacterium]